MQKYQTIIQSLQKHFDDQKFEQLLNEIKNRGGAILLKEDAHSLPKASLTNFLRKNIMSSYPESFKTSKNSIPDWFVYFNKVLAVIYSQRSATKTILYRVLPALAIKLIQIYSSDIKYFDECLLTIYNNEYQEYNSNQLEKSEPSKNPDLTSLYQKHMLRQMTQFQYQNLEKIDKITNTNRSTIKSLIFYLIYKSAGEFGRESLMDFYRAIFIYCGVDEKEVMSSKNSLYLLEKTGKVSVFRFQICEEEVSWMILTLYELFTRMNQDKFDLLATINILHKKVSNQCQFKMSEVAQSLIHLLEDEYQSVFS